MERGVATVPVDAFPECDPSCCFLRSPTFRASGQMTSKNDEKHTVTIDPSCLDEVSTAEAKRARRRIRRRKTLSPSKVTTFMDGVDLANSDPMSWPAIPCDNRVGGGPRNNGHSSSDSLTHVVVTPSAVRHPSSSWVASSEISAMVADDPTPATVRRASKPLGVLGAIQNQDPSRRSVVLGRKITDGNVRGALDRRVALQTENAESGAIGNVTSSTGTSQVRSSDMGSRKPAVVPSEHVIDVGDSVPATSGRGRNGNRSSRRRSIVLPSKAEPLMGVIDEMDDRGSTSRDGDAAQDERPQRTPSNAAETNPGTVERPVAVAAESCLPRPLAAQHGWQSAPGETTKTLVRAFYAAPKGSQRARRIAARHFCLTGYPLLPTTPSDARVLCEAAGSSFDWGIEETEPELTSQPLRRRTREEKRELVLRIKVRCLRHAPSCGVAVLGAPAERVPVVQKSNAPSVAHRLSSIFS